MNKKIKLFKKKDYDINKTCGFIIHKDLPAIEELAGCSNFKTCSKEKLKNYFEEIIEKGITHFIIQLGYGITELIAEVVDDLRQNMPEIELEVIIPTKEYEKTQEAERVFNKCTQITAIAKQVTENHKYVCYQKILDVCGELLFISNEIRCDLRIKNIGEKCKEYISAGFDDSQDEIQILNEFLKKHISEEQLKLFMTKYNEYTMEELEEGFNKAVAYLITNAEKYLK